MVDEFNRKYEVINKIGEGSFSDVLKVREKRTGIMFAAKRLTKAYSSAHAVNENKEVEVLQKLEIHPNVVGMIDSFYNCVNGSLILLFELMDCSMYDFIKNRNRRLSESRVKNYLYQLVCGLHHLHRNGLFHRDIKPENILIKVNSKLRANPLKAEIVKLADLGSVCMDRRLPHSAYISTRWYRAPECLLTSGYYGSKMDIWALGCCFYEMITLLPIFPGDDEIDQLHKIHQIVGSPSPTLLAKFKQRSISLEFPKKNPISFHNLLPMLSQYGVDVLKKTLIYHPDTRISVYKLMDHVYFEEFNKRARHTSRLVDRDCYSEHGSRMKLSISKGSKSSSLSLNSTFRQVSSTQSQAN